MMGMQGQGILSPSCHTLYPTRSQFEFQLLTIPMPHAWHYHDAHFICVCALSLATVEYREYISMLIAVTSKFWDGTASFTSPATGTFWWAVESVSSPSSTWLGSRSERICMRMQCKNMKTNSEGHMHKPHTTARKNVIALLGSLHADMQWHIHTYTFTDVRCICNNVHKQCYRASIHKK